MKKQVCKKVMYRINVFLVENNIITTKFYKIKTLLSRDIIIETINKKEAKNLKKIDS